MAYPIVKNPFEDIKFNTIDKYIHEPKEPVKPKPPINRNSDSLVTGCLGGGIVISAFMILGVLMTEEL
jgi:hypothetical protein